MSFQFWREGKPPNIEKKASSKIRNPYLLVDTGTPIGLGCVETVIIAALVAVAILGTAAYLFKKRRKS
jgi:LPXTG-motif cell wall-anchored protein